MNQAPRVDRSAGRQPTTIGMIIVAIANALVERGISPTVVLRHAPLDHLPSNDPLDRVTPSTIAQTLRAAVEATGNPNFGLEVARHIRPITMHALGYSLEASDTLRDFGNRLARFARLVSQSGSTAFETTQDGAKIEVSDIDRTVCAEAEDAWTGFLVHFIRDLTNAQFGPALVELHRAVPEDGGAAHQAFFSCPLRFGCDRIAFHFDADIVDKPLTHASREIAEANDRLVIAHLAQLDSNDVTHRVRVVLAHDLSAGHPTKNKVARKLNMSARTLQTKLAERNTSFYELVNDARFALALAYMENRSISVTEISYLLGFSDPSSFGRAFKRWTGRSPSDYRTGQTAPA